MVAMVPMTVALAAVAVLLCFIILLAIGFSPETRSLSLKY